MMKNLIILTLVATTLFIAACKKDKTDKAYYMKAGKNEVKWTAGPSAAYNIHDANADTISLEGYNNPGEERLHITLFKNSSGKYQALYSQIYYQNTVGQDALVSYYKPDTTASNQVTIDNADTKAHIIAGSFDLTFKKVTGDSNFPAIVHFKQGVFKSTLKQIDYSKGLFAL